MAASERVARGVLYALTRGMDPRMKDGVRAHPIVLVGGAVFHLGIAAAVLAVVASFVTEAVPQPWFRLVTAFLAGGGVISGGGLLLRRFREPVLRAISTPDDYISNLLVLAWLAATVAVSVAPLLELVRLGFAAAVAVYAPFGKIRHCVLFFIARARFGAFIGARGVLIARARR